MRPAIVQPIGTVEESPPQSNERPSLSPQAAQQKDH